MSNTLIKDLNSNGFKSANKGDFVTAENEFRKAFYLNPLDQTLLFNFIKVLHVQKKYSEILDFISKTSIQTRSNWNPSILFLAGQSAIQLNNDNLAREIYETLNSKNPKEAEFALPLSQVLLKLGDLDKAISILNKAIRFNLDNPSLLSNLAIVLSEKGEYKESEDIYLKVIKITPNQFLGYYNYSLFLYNQNRFKESLNAINKALKIVPSAKEGKNIKHKILERLESYNDESTNLDKGYSAIEKKDWEKSFYYLSKVNDSEKDSKFIAALTYLPEKYQSRFGDSRQFDPQYLVKREKFLDQSDATIATLIKLVKNNSTLVWNRSEKPTKNGFQTHEILADENSHISKLISKKLFYLATNYLFEFLKFDRNFDQVNLKLSGWAVILQSEGKQERHIHPDSLVSGVLYLKIPEIVSKISNEYGNLLFPSFKELSIAPSSGELILFPSYLPHETIKFKSSEERICIAFNLIDDRK
jgi:tetratricopeptide (TPR) repeat protein